MLMAQLCDTCSGRGMRPCSVGTLLSQHSVFGGQVGLINLCVLLVCFYMYVGY